MRLFLLVALTMTAFAANSVLNRAALASGGIDAVSFGTLRLLSGALMLAALVLAREGRLQLGGAGRLAGVAGLFLYIYGFSVAYAGMPAGLGALLLFGMVQVTMFGGSVAGGERVPAQRWLGAGLAFGGLVWLLWPGGGSAPSLPHALAMLLAGIGWGIYSLAGRKAEVALVSTAANFVLATGLGLVVLLGSIFSLSVVVQALMAVPVQGSVVLFLAGAVLMVFAMTGLGIFLATIAGSMPQFALLLMMALLPLQVLSGAMTPRESMPEIIQTIMLAAPNTHFIILSQGILFRGAGLDVVWPQFAALAAIGVALFWLALIRFKKFLR